jgi:hypothetical protein
MANLKLKENLDLKSTGSSTSGLNSLPKTGDIIPFAGTTAPTGWAICDGTSGTPDLRGRFVKSPNANPANVGVAINSEHGHNYSTNSFNFTGTTNAHDGVDTGVSYGGNGTSHGHSVSTSFGSGSGANNLLANSTNSGGPIAFVSRPHSHNGSGSVNFGAAGVGGHNHAGFGLRTSDRTDAHNTNHSILSSPTGTTSNTERVIVPFIIMNYIMKV